MRQKTVFYSKQNKLSSIEKITKKNHINSNEIITLDHQMGV